MEGLDAVIGAVLWERFVVDPVPGPIGIDELVNSRPIGRNIALMRGSSYALRGGRVVRPQLSVVLEALGEEGVGLSIRGSVAEVAEELIRYVTEANVSSIVAVDVGGDSLATGCEDGLRSPLVDSYSLAIISRVHEEAHVPAILGIAGPGIDGELDRDYVLMMMSDAAQRGGYLGAVGLGQRNLGLMKSVLANAITEASRLLVNAAEGQYGEVAIRSGLRRVKLDVSMSITYYLDLGAILDDLPMVRIVMDSTDPWDAMRRMNREGIYTELNMEEEIYEFYKREGRMPNTSELRDLVERIRNSLGECRIRQPSTGIA
jgi:hypothetical protein